jgi:hypothetical protein
LKFPRFTDYSYIIQFNGTSKHLQTTVLLIKNILGKYVEETGWDELQAATHTFDNHSYSWKKFSDAGYHTLFAEDAPKIAIWNFEKPGN